jgi:hypothetical protein
MSQKPDMMSSHATSRGSAILTKVRLSTPKIDSRLSAPLGTSLNVKSMNRLRAVNAAEAIKRFRQLAREWSWVRSSPGR